MLQTVSFICPVEKVNVRTLFLNSLFATPSHHLTTMAPVSKQKRHLKRVAELLRESPATPKDSLSLDEVRLSSSLVPSFLNRDDAEDEAIDENLNSWVGFFHENHIDELSSEAWLQWKEGAGTQFRKAYDGTGRSSMFSKRAEKRRREQLMSQSRKIHSYFSINSSSHPYNCPENEVCREDGDEHSLFSVNVAIEKLQSIVRISSNKRTEKQNSKTKFKFIRHLAVLRFLQKVHDNPRSRVKSSKDVAADFRRRRAQSQKNSEVERRVRSNSSNDGPKASQAPENRITDR